MKKILLLTGIMILTVAAYCQPDRNIQDRKEQIKAQKVAYLTNRLQLTPQEAEIFWPLYNEYEQKIEAEERPKIDQFFNKKPDIAIMSDEEINQFILDRLQHEQNLIDIRKEYFEKFKEILSIRKVFRLYEAEMEFRKILLEKLSEYQRNKNRPFNR